MSKSFSHILHPVESALADASNAIADAHATIAGADTPSTVRNAYGLRLLDIDNAIDKALRLCQAQIERDKRQMEDR